MRHPARDVLARHVDRRVTRHLRQVLRRLPVVDTERLQHVRVREKLGRERRVRRNGAAHVQALGAQLRQNRFDHVDLFAAQVTRFNELLAKTIADLDEPRSPLLLASPPPSYDIHLDTYDGTHPNAGGEHKIAEAFANAMYQAWGVGLSGLSLNQTP